MPGPIKDRQLRHHVRMLDHRPEKKIGNDNLFDFLASIGDKSGRKFMATMRALQAPGVTREDQIEIVREGMDDQEKLDVETMLSNDSISWAPEARNFMEALVGQAPVESGDPLPLSDELTARFQELAPNGETLEVVNISANPEAALQADSMEVKADEWGKFHGNLNDVQEGDHLRVRTRDSQGNVSNWITMQAGGIDAVDTRNAQTQTETFGLEANENGDVELIYIGDGMISEPNAQFRLTNNRSGETFDFQLDGEGKLPPGLSFKGEANDEFSIAVSDGVNNVNFSKVSGVVKVEGPPEPVDLVDPSPWKKRHVDDDGNPTITTQRYSGPLFIDGASASDVKQGSLANCYFCAAASSVAHSSPEVIQDMMKDNGDGTYTVTFKEETYYNSGRFRTRKVTVDGDLYKRSSGNRPMYGGSVGETYDPDKMELWFPILEKAYAKLNGNSYDEVGNGGNSGKIMAMLVGGTRRSHTISDSNMESVYNRMKEATESGHPMTASTYGKDSDEAERYSGKRVYAWHAYTVLGVEESEGKKYVNLRNPWGNSEPGNDGKDDGIFKLELAEFAHLYKSVAIAKPNN
ncbi:MAG: hypothetical protein EP343_28150 [Deltaproteobacteria bacterium]|nr:MAG: hypothetical protein EP343_28150 [Deltaproteobacteria bacterium]